MLGQQASGLQKRGHQSRLDHLPVALGAGPATHPPASPLRRQGQPPFEDGGATITQYRVEWDSSEAVHEVQRVKFKATDIVGAFALAFQGATTPPIPAGASGERLKTALEALPALDDRALWAGVDFSPL